jgi:tRNA 2-selenouridine synthase
MTSFALSDLSGLSALPFDSVIDVRAPSEFAEDHLPGAVNLPVLDDSERARVGTVYVQQSPFLARKIGAALVSRNAAAHLEGPLADKPGGWRPLVYCWRGGQRSNSFATILGQIGWRVAVLDGGYRSYRRLVSKALYDTTLQHRLVIVDGGTGTAKTAILGRLAERGAQVLDLEGMAHHRGSVFGGRGEAQPAQKLFETRIAQGIAACDPARPVFVEAESNKVGECRVPPMLWQAMRAAPRFEVAAPAEARARYLVAAYADVIADPQAILATLDKLRVYHGAEQVADWQGMAGAGDWTRLAAELVEKHYDPRYRKSALSGQPAGRRLELDDLTPPEIDRAAAWLEQAAEGIGVAG